MREVRKRQDRTNMRRICNNITERYWLAWQAVETMEGRTVSQIVATQVRNRKKVMG